MEAISYERLFNNLDGARIEGRLETVTQRQKEIQKIHGALQASEVELLQDLQKDLGWSEEDALLELSFVLQTLRILFGSLDIKQSIASEHLISTSKEALSRRKPLGNFLIIAESAAPITQSIIPLGMAVAEGNTALVVLPYGAPATSTLLLKIIHDSMDQDAITALKPTSVSSQSSVLSAFSKVKFQAIIVQSPAVRAQITHLAYLQNSPDTRIIYHVPKHSYVIVTRNADLEKAALDIANAKFSFFSGAASTAPRLAMIDEFVMGKFLGLLEKSIRTVAANRSLKVKIKPRNVASQTTRTMKCFSSAQKGGRIVNVNPETSGETLLIGEPQWSGVENFQNSDKADGEDGLWYPDPILSILTTTSMDAAMTILSQINSNADPTTIFLFSNRSEARYLSLFTTSTSTYLNHIPLEAALNPYPTTDIPTIQQQFCQIQTIHTAYSTASSTPAKQLYNAFTSSVGRTEGLKMLVREALAVPKQRSGAQVGFFLQGGFIMLGHIFVLLSLLITGVVWGLNSYFKKLNPQNRDKVLG